MAMSRRALLLRLAIYGPLLGYFGWQAWGRYQAGRAAEREEAIRKARIEQLLREQTRKVTLPDGTTREVQMITPEQAEEIWGIRPGAGEEATPAPAGADAPTPAAKPTPAPSAARPTPDPSAPKPTPDPSAPAVPAAPAAADPGAPPPSR